MTEEINSDEDQKMPLLLACGYRKIKTKSGLSFPTFLVTIPTEPQRQVWRSKRDFLILGRATAEHNKRLPKAALGKLSEKAPWKRPDVDIAKNCEGPNVYHISMKKSVRQMDQYLQEACVCALENGEKVKDAWDVFCRPGDTDMLVPQSPGNDDDNENDSTWGITSQQQSSRLGQYFASSDNSKKLIGVVLERISCYLVDSHTHLVFVEPSCGHGDIVAALVNDLGARKIPSSKFSIMGFDLDQNAVKTCRQLPFSNPIDFSCQNFLQTTMKERDKQSMVVCIGGPPYTTGPGSSEELRRDLPELFVNHCLQEWKAQLVCFLMPARYGKSPIAVSPDYTCQSFELDSSTFYFQGSLPVVQPSILQCFARKTLP
jgi:hypothetical protein